MEIKQEFEDLNEYLNEYQKKFVEITVDLFCQINISKISENSYIMFNKKNRILEILLEHIETPDVSLLFIIHEDMIEISCSEFEYYMDSVKSSLFEDLSDDEFYINIKAFVYNALKGNYRFKLYSYKGKTVKSEIIWKENIYPQLKYSYFWFYYKRKELEIEDVVVHSFINGDD